MKTSVFQAARLLFLSAIAAFAVLGSISESGAIWHGEVDSSGQFTNVVRLKVRISGNPLLSECSGVLLSPHIVATVAHCVRFDGSTATSVQVFYQNGRTHAVAMSKAVKILDDGIKSGDKQWELRTAHTWHAVGTLDDCRCLMHSLTYADIAVVELDKDLPFDSSTPTLPSNSPLEDMLKTDAARSAANKNSLKAYLVGYADPACRPSAECATIGKERRLREVGVAYDFVCNGPATKSRIRYVGETWCVESEPTASDGDSGGGLFLEMKDGRKFLVGLVSMSATRSSLGHEYQIELMPSLNVKLPQFKVGQQ